MEFLDQVIASLKRPPHLRILQQKQTLMNYLKSVRYFKEKYDEVCEFFSQKSLDHLSQEEFLNEIAEGVKYEYFEPGNLVFHHKAIGDRLFVILKGKVNIYVPKGLDELKHSKKLLDYLLTNHGSEDNSRNSMNVAAPDKIRTIFRENKLLSDINLFILDKWHLFRQIVTPDDLLLLTIGHLEEYYEDGVFRYKRLSVCGEGDNFGEIAMQQNVPRSATVVCIEPLHVLTLNRDVFRKVFSTAMHHDQEKEIFFENLFPGIQRETRTKVKAFLIGWRLLVCLWVHKKKVLSQSDAVLPGQTPRPNFYYKKRGSRGNFDLQET